VRPILLYLPTVGDLTATNRAAVFEVKRAAGAKFGVPLVDLTADLKSRGKELYLDADPVHLDKQGNAIVAGRLLETITNSLTQ
jgi:lysophospholipase L1-like esterase